MNKKIKITPGFFAMISLLGWINLRLAVIFLLAIFLHEISHCIAAWVVHVKIEKVDLCIYGAVIHSYAMNYRQELIIAAMGPISSFLLGSIFLRINATFFAISIGLAAWNLLPVYPMDGGRMLHALLAMRCCPTTVSTALRITAYFTCCLLMLGACWFAAKFQAGLWPIFAALFLLLRVIDSSLQT